MSLWFTTKEGKRTSVYSVGIGILIPPLLILALAALFAVLRGYAG